MQDWAQHHTLRPFELIFSDPPYNQGTDYGSGPREDRLSPSAYGDFTRRWVKLCCDLLHPQGSFWVLIDDTWAATMDATLRNTGLTRRNWIKWYEKFGNNCTKKFNRTSRHLLYYVKDPKKFTFNTATILVPSARQHVYHDKRANPYGKLLDDVWDIPRLAGTHKERVKGAPNQLPLELLRRIIESTSNPGDHILDPFGGSGTTAIAALSSHRWATLIERSTSQFKIALDRLSGSAVLLDRRPKDGP